MEKKVLYLLEKLRNVLELNNKQKQKKNEKQNNNNKKETLPQNLEGTVMVNVCPV